MNLDEFDACLIYSYDDGTPFMYLGSCGDAKHSKLTDKYKITHVLNVTEEIDNFHNDIVYKKIEIEDNPRTDIQNHFQDAHSFLKQVYDSKATVLVHCQAGISRSSTMVISYLMKHLNMNLMEAYNHTKSRRKVISSNLGFMLKLIAFEKELYNPEKPSISIHEYATDWVGGFLGEHDRQKVLEIFIKHKENFDTAMDEVFSL